MLRHPACKSSFDDLIPGSEFRRLIPDESVSIKAADPSTIKRNIFCTGRAYYDLEKERSTRGLESTVALTRIEQLCPFPFDLVRDEILRYPNANLVWSQEEHKNQGFWNYIVPNMQCVLDHVQSDKKLQYVNPDLCVLCCMFDYLLFLASGTLAVKLVPPLPRATSTCTRKSL